MNKAARNWDQFSLLLIDIQGDFWPDKFSTDFPKFPNNIRELLTLCRRESIEVIHLRASNKPDMSDWMLRYRLEEWIPCIEDTDGASTHSFAKEKPGEAVFIKKTFDGFHNPDLLRYLKQQGKRYILTAGLVTSVCVFLTTVSAAQLGFLTSIIEDCCADEPLIHQQILDRYRFIFGRTSLNMLCEDYDKWIVELEKVKD